MCFGDRHHDFHFLVELKAGAHKDKPGFQQRVRLLDRLCLGDQRLKGTPVADVRQATTGAAWKAQTMCNQMITKPANLNKQRVLHVKKAPFRRIDVG